MSRRMAMCETEESPRRRRTARTRRSGARPIPAAARLLAVPLLAVPLLAVLIAGAGCERKREIAGAFPVDLTRESVCAVDGMLLMDHPGPKGQVLLKDGTIRFYCDLKELFGALHDPNQAHRIAQASVQPFDERAWGTYADGWAAVESLVYVLGSRQSGSMGPTLVPFRTEEAARGFAAAHGGRTVPAAALTAEAVARYLREVRERMRAGGTMHGAEGRTGDRDDGMPAHDR